MTRLLTLNKCMKMKIKTRSDLPIKYYLGIYLEENLVDEDSILFEILQYLIRVLEAKEKELSYSNLKFSSKSLKYVFGDRMNDETFKNKVVQSLKKALSSKKLVADSNFINFTESGITQFYTVE